MQVPLNLSMAIMRAKARSKHWRKLTSRPDHFAGPARTMSLTIQASGIGDGRARMRSMKRWAYASPIAQSAT